MDHLYKRHFGQIPVQKLLAVGFWFLLILSVTSAAWLLISSANRIVSKVATDRANSTTTQATLEIQRFLRTPSVLGQSLEHALREGYIDTNDPDSLTRYIFELSKRNIDYGVSGIYLANVDGNLASIDSELKDDVASWSVLHASGETNGKLNKYSVNPDGSAGDLIEEGLPYNSTTRPWFRQAMANSSSVWTDVYKDASSGQPVLTWAYAIRDSKGELIALAGVDLLLSRIHQFLDQLPGSENSTFLLSDRHGNLIGSEANSSSESHQDDKLHPQQLLDYLKEQHGGITSIDEVVQTQTTIENHSGLLKVMPLSENIELAWRIAVYVPVSDYLGSLSNQFLKLIPFVLLAIFIIWFALQLFLRLIVKPLVVLKSAANRIAAGQFNVFVDTSCSNEVGELARSIESMRFRLNKAFKDVNEQKIKAETTLASITNGVITADNEGNVEYMNRAALSQFGLSANEVMGKPLEKIFNAHDVTSDEMLDSQTIINVIKKGDPYDCELKILDTTQNQRTIECRICPLSIKPGEKTRGAVLVFRDVTEQIELKTELERQASIDELTGLMNRRQFEKHLESTVASVADTENTHCLCYMDLDQFKIVNDTCGHVAGDELLRQVGQLLRNLVRQGDAIARLGGDEFAMLLDRCVVEEGARVTGKLLTTISNFQFIWEDRVFSIGISIGLVTIDQRSLSASAVLADADTACYAAKDGGRNRIHIYRPDDMELADRREELRLANEVDSALINDQFELLTQEIRAIDGTSDRVAHFEVLVRMQASDGSLVPPDRFFSTAERYDLASKIDRWVVVTTLKHLEKNQTLLPMINQCSINISGQSVGDEKFIDWLLSHLDSTSVPVQKLCFEITETSAIANLNNAIALMSELHSRGCSLALDDFGSGFSSLAYLKTLPFDYMKIDGMFVKGITVDEQDLAMVKLINEIGKTMGMKTVAEFVESDEIRQQLVKVGVDYVQGYAIDVPRPIDQLGALPDSEVLDAG